MRLRALLACLPLLLSAPALHADSLAAGRAAFKRCVNCHQVGPGARSNFGPQLNGIIGRRAGSAPDFDYSPALKKAGFTWNEQNLAAFLRAHPAPPSTATGGRR
ncbi:cytochrome c family protein [Massilia sp. BSC265]|uniref:c-type cytochrome n=1 Tax=Massilia sp. BSC265 TaxID=1549812 RepID=UPI00068B0A5B|nr:c-type cytochrome [Massilia sp. BSC265]